MVRMGGPPGRCPRAKSLPLNSIGSFIAFARLYSLTLRLPLEARILGASPRGLRDSGALQNRTDVAGSMQNPHYADFVRMIPEEDEISAMDDRSQSRRDVRSFTETA